MRTSMFALAICLTVSAVAHGGMIVSLQPVAVQAGSSGGFDVLLTNTGPSTITVGGFTFGISIGESSFSLTDANTSTVLSEYIFEGNSLFGPDLAGPSSGQTLIVSDVFSTPLFGTAVTAGGSVGLGHVLFTVAPDAPEGAYTSMLNAATTSLADELGNRIEVTTLSNGTINVSAIPEPSSLLLVLAGGGLIWFRKRA